MKHHANYSDCARVTRSNGGSSVRDAQAALGGADALPDTPDVPATGAEPEQAGIEPARGAVQPRGPTYTVEWVLVNVVLVVLLLVVNGAWMCHA